MYKIAVFIFLLLFIIIFPIFSTKLIVLSKNEYNGIYIGQHIEYISEKELIEILKDNWKVDKVFKDKMISGQFHSDRNLKMRIDYSSDGYKAYIDSKNKNAVIKWGVNDVIQNEKKLNYVSAKKEIFSLNYNPHAYWLKFKILNDSENDMELYLEQDKQIFIWFDLFTKNENGYILKKGSFETPLHKREMKYKNIVFCIKVKPGLNTYYIRTDSYFIDTLPIRIWNKKGFIKSAAKDNAYQGIILGIFLVLIVYCIFFYISEKNISYIYLMFVILGSLLLFLCTSGFGLQHIWEKSSMFGGVLLLTAFPISIIVNLLFCISFIEIKKHTPIIHKIIIGIIFISAILLILVLILPGYLRNYLFLITMIIEHTHFLPVIFSVIIVIRKKNYLGIFLLIGIFLHILSQAEFFISRMNIIPYEFINYINIRGFSFIILMTFGLSYKIRKINKSLSDLKIKITEITEKLKGKKTITDESILKIETVKEYINNNYHENITRDSLSYAVGYSPDHLGRIFKQYTGEKIADYLNKIRIMNAAKKLKEKNDNIIDIAFDVGFESLRTFNKVFLEIMKESPSSYRKKSV